MMLLVACGGSSGSGQSSPPTCAPTGSALNLAAPGLKFDTDCLATLPNEPFTVTFDNQDSGTTHNFLISVAFNPGSDVLFQGDPITGVNTVTYDVPALAAGTYSFECSIHPSFMHGTFIVAAASSASTTATASS
jgi:plastocyanin